MIIRRAVPAEADDIRELTSALNIDRNSGKDTGFLEYMAPSRESFAERVSTGRFLAAMGGDLLVGFSSCYTDRMLTYPRMEFDRDEIVQHVLKKPKPFVYWDLCGVREGYRKRGIAKSLMIESLECWAWLGYRTLWYASSLDANRNGAFIRLITAQGDGELVERISAYEGLAFGLYRMNL